MVSRRLRTFERPLDGYDDPDEHYEEVIRCLGSCTESNDSRAAFLGFGRQVFAAPVLGYPGYAVKSKQGAHHQLLVVVKDETDYAMPGGACYDVAMHYLNEDGSAFASPDMARFGEGGQVDYDAEFARALCTAMYDASQYGWFDYTEASLAALQIQASDERLR